MHELQQILLQKLPRLCELTFGCILTNEINQWMILDSNRNVAPLVNGSVHAFGIMGYKGSMEGIKPYPKIVGHPFTHADILEALGEDWAMTGDYKLWKVDMGYKGMAETRFYNLTCELPQNLKDLDKPEYKETCERLISLIK